MIGDFPDQVNLLEIYKNKKYIIRVGPEQKLDESESTRVQALLNKLKIQISNEQVEIHNKVNISTKNLNEKMEELEKSLRISMTQSHDGMMNQMKIYMNDMVNKNT